MAMRDERLSGNEGCSGQSEVVMSVAERKSGVEILRIVAMFIIVANHFSTHGALRSVANAHVSFLNTLVAQILACGGKLGVDIFVLISAYFLCTKTVRVSSMVRLWIRCVVWGLILCGVAQLAGLHVGSRMLWMALLPVSCQNYWFVTAYFVMLVLSPFLSVGLRGLGRKRHALLIGVLLFIYAVAPAVTLWSGTRPLFGFSNVTWFVVLFVVGSYVRLHGHGIGISRRTLFWTLASALLAVLGWILLSHVFHGLRWNAVREMNCPVTLAIALSSLMIAVGAKVGVCGWLNRVAACMFGVYLIHDNPLMRGLIWNRLVHASSLVRQDLFPVTALAAILLVFLSCVFLDYLLGLVLRPLEDALRSRLSGVDRSVCRLFEGMR